jgi:hypothetical protein
MDPKPAKRAKRVSGPVAHCLTATRRCLKDASIAAGFGPTEAIDAACVRALEYFMGNSALSSGVRADACIVLPLSSFDQLAGTEYIAIPCSLVESTQHYVPVGRALQKGEPWLEAGLAMLSEQLKDNARGRAAIADHWQRELARFCQPWTVVAAFGPGAIKLCGASTVFGVYGRDDPEVHKAASTLRQTALLPYAPPSEADMADALGCERADLKEGEWRAAHWQMATERSASFRSRVKFGTDPTEISTDADMLAYRLQQSRTLLVSGSLMDDWKADDPILTVWALQPAAVKQLLVEILEDWTHFKAWQAFAEAKRNGTGQAS